MKFKRWIALSAAALVLLAIAARLCAITLWPGHIRLSWRLDEPGQTRIEYKLGAGGAYVTEPWSTAFAVDWDTLLAPGTDWWIGSADTLYLRLQFRDARDNESAWYTYAPDSLDCLRWLPPDLTPPLLAWRSGENAAETSVAPA